MTEGTIDIQRSSRVSTITFSHPAHNSLPGKLLAELRDAIEEEGRTSETSVIVVRSGGERTFCAGASFDELLSIKDAAQGKEFFMGFARVINAMRQCPKFVIGRVQGKAIGGGVGLASATDYCFATQWSSVKLSELALGIGPFVVGPAVRRKIGTGAFAQMSIHASGWQTAQWAWQRGMYAEVYKDATEMDSHIDRLCTELTAYSPEAMREMKAALWRGCEDWSTLLPERAAISGRLILSDAAQAAVNKVKNKS